jgi:hypothetical protein
MDKGGIRINKNEKIGEFILIKPVKNSDKEDIAEELKKLLDLGVEIIKYSEIKPDKVTVKRAKNYKIKIYMRGYEYPRSDKLITFFNKETGELNGYDKKETAIIPVYNFNGGRYSHTSFNRSSWKDKIALIKYKHKIKSVIYVTEATHRNYLRDAGYKTVNELFSTIDLTKFSKYVETDEIENTINKIPKLVLENFPELLPKSFNVLLNLKLAKKIAGLEYISWGSLGVKSSKFDYDGLVKKYHMNLKMRYPLLPSYLKSDKDDTPTKIKNIKNYIKLC